MVNLATLNPQQRQAVEAVKGPVLILAGAGTGKTRVITFRIAHMIHQDIAPGNILGVTFTNKAAREMQERVTKLLPPARRAHNSSERDPRDERPTISTFHSLCVRILRQHIDRLGYKRNFVIYDESEQLGAIKKILSQISNKGEKTDPAAVLSLLSRYKNTGTAGAFADPNLAALAEHVKKRYESALHACNAVDFDDLILLVLRLFDEFPDVLDACRRRYQYVMVDEYQDTNAAQFRLVHGLTEKHRNLCVVGDDDQSIYGWRGAEIANLLDLEKFYPEVKVVKLEQNYRSTNTILSAANALIKNNARRRAKRLWSQNGQGAKLVLYTFESDEEEARFAAERIEGDRMLHAIPWSQQAILFRTNIQSRPIETALRQAGIRYHLIGGQSFFDRREIKDFFAYLKMLINPNDDISLLRVANVPARGLSDVTMERLLAASHEKHTSVYQAMRSPETQSLLFSKSRESLSEFLHWLDQARMPLQQIAPGFVLSHWADKLMTDIGYYSDLRRSEKNPETAENRVQNLKDLIFSLDNVSPAAKPADRLETFLEDITLDAERKEEKEAQGDAVTLITMHSCKGLEYPHVHIVGLEDGLLPHSRSKVEGTLDEERRLFYVAITRAMKTLTISHCQGRKKYGQVMPCHPSHFLNELPEELVERGEEKAKKPVSIDSGKNLFASMRSQIG